MSSQENKIFDVAIIGGGITGIGIFRDLSLHGISSVMIEKGEFCSETSAKSSKMLHGGIRYLEQLDFSLVRDALQEKDIWLNLCPEQCFRKEFYLPLYKDSKHFPLLIRAGMFLYSKILSRSKTVGGYINAKKLMSIIPEIKKERLRGAGFYTDAVMDDYGLGIACLEDALSYKVGSALNHSEVTKINKINDHYEITYTNLKDNQSQVIKSKFVVMAVGPFTDQVAKRLIDPNWENMMVPSKGIHLWLKKDTLDLKDAVVLVTKDDRVVFVIPQDKGILLGTTDEFLASDFKEVKAEESEINYLLKEINNYFPGKNINKEHITATYAGVRPLVKDPNAKKAGDVSRHHQVKIIEDNFFLIAGGKYTTFRLMAQDVVRPIANLLRVKYSVNKSLAPLKSASK